MVSSTLIKSCILNDRAAYQELYESCIPYVYNVVKRYISNPEDCKDTVQEVFAKVFLKLGTYDNQRGEFKPWIRKVTVNECLMHLRKSAKIAVYSMDDQYELFDEDASKTLESLTRDDIINLLSDMPQGYKTVFLAYIIDGYDHKEIAQKLGISKEASRSQLSRSKKWLLKNIKTNNKYKAYGLI